jgi:hypothetical protein
MALDLELSAISNKANFIIDKARQNRNYANDMHMICRINDLQHQLKMVQSSENNSEQVSSLTELIQDSEYINSLYPVSQKNSFRFFSSTRGYSTLTYLLHQYLKDRPQLVENENIFYGGVDIDFAKQFVQFRYLDTNRTIETCDLLNAVEFNDLLPYYDFEAMTGQQIYKLTRPEGLEQLRAEFEELKRFYRNAKQLDAFVITKIS